MPIAELLLYGVLVPVAVCGLALAAMQRPWRAVGAGGNRWAGALAHGGGYIAGYAALFGWPTLPPHEGWQWLAYVAVIAIAGGLIDASPGPAIVARWGVRLAVAALSAWLLVPGWMDARPLWVPVLGATILALWWVLRGLAGRASGACLSLVILVALVGAGGVLVQSGLARFGQLAVALAATFGARWLIVLWNRSAGEDFGVWAVPAVLLPGLMFTGYFNNYSEVPAAVFILAALAPLAACVGDIAPLRRLTGWPATLTRTAAVLMVAGVAVAVALAYTE